MHFLLAFECLTKFLFCVKTSENLVPAIDLGKVFQKMQEPDAASSDALDYVPFLEGRLVFCRCHLPALEIGVPEGG